MTTELDSSPSYPRLTKSVRQQLLDQNDGLTFQTYFQSRNSREARTYTVKDGMLQIRAHGKGAFGGSQYDTTWTASPDEVHRAIYGNRHEFDYSGVDPRLPMSVEPLEDVAVSLIPDDVVADLGDKSNPEAQSRVAAWFEGLSAREKLIIGGVVVTVVAGGVVIYRYRQPIAEKLRRTRAVLRKKIPRGLAPTDG